MPALSSNRIAWLYTDDAGHTWRVAADKALTDQNKLGGSAASITDLQRPAGWKMRRTTVSDGAGHSRVVPVYEPTAPIVTPGETINFNANVAGVIASVTGSSNGGFIREGASRHNVIKQTT